MRGRPRKNAIQVPLENQLENLPSVDEFKPLLSKKAADHVAEKESQLMEATKTMQAIQRRIAVLENEIEKEVGEKQKKVKDLKKLLSIGKKNTAGRVAEIWTIIQYDTSDIPGATEYEKKQFMSSQRRELAK